jgi:putative transposase
MVASLIFPMSFRAIFPLEFYHVYNRAVLKMALFKDHEDYLRFICKMLEVRRHSRVQILAFCLMPNHFHLLLKESAGKNISRFLQRLQGAYAMYFMQKYKHSGRVFQGVFKSKHIKDDAYFDRIIAYIHQNPVRDGLVKTVKDWPFSSAVIKLKAGGHLYKFVDEDNLVTIRSDIQLEKIFDRGVGMAYADANSRKKAKLIGKLLAD